MRIAFLVARVVVAAAILVAVVAQLRSSLGYVDSDIPGAAHDVVVNFVSYFTVDSNLLAAATLLIGAALLLRAQASGPDRFTVIRMSVTTYMVLTGVVYNLLLRGLLVQGAVVAWSNEILHVVGPLYLALDWFLAPGRTALRWRDAFTALVFPIVWVGYTLVRGPNATDPFRGTNYWYPYPFLNPVTSVGGYASVTGYVIGIAVVVIALAFGLTWSTRPRRPAATASVLPRRRG